MIYTLIMQHQDFSVVRIGNPQKARLTGPKQIVPKNHSDQRAIKIENETENFHVKTVPSELAKEIMQARTAKKYTQKDMANKLNIQQNVYVSIENGKALYDPATKKIIQNIEKNLGIKFTKK
jgi:putative transcription factor